MHLIFKYPLEITDVQRIDMPSGADVLSAQVQNGVLCVWAIFDQRFSQMLERRTFYIVGTGNPIPDEYVKGNLFVGTVQRVSFVWHIFVSRNRG